MAFPAGHSPVEHQFIAGWLAGDAPANVWIGSTVVNQEEADRDIPKLLAVPARVRFLSIEPLLEDVGKLNLSGIDWAIIGGESGPGCRPMEKPWVVSLRRQCREAKVRFFFKQWGGFPKGVRGRELDGRTYDDSPPRLALPMPTAADRAKAVAEAKPFLAFRVSRVLDAANVSTPEGRARAAAAAIEVVRDLFHNGDYPAIIFVFGRELCFDTARLLKTCRRFTTDEEHKRISVLCDATLQVRGVDGVRGVRCQHQA